MATRRCVVSWPVEVEGTYARIQKWRKNCAEKKKCLNRRRRFGGQRTERYMSQVLTWHQHHQLNLRTLLTINVLDTVTFIYSSINGQTLSQIPNYLVLIIPEFTYVLEDKRRAGSHKVKSPKSKKKKQKSRTRPTNRNNKRSHLSVRGRLDPFILKKLEYT